MADFRVSQSVFTAFKNLAHMSSMCTTKFVRTESCIWLRVVNQHVLRFIVLEVKIPCSSSLKAKAIASCAREYNNCSSFGNKSTSSRILTKLASLAAFYTVSIKHGLRTVDCRLQTADYGLGI